MRKTLLTLATLGVLASGASVSTQQAQTPPPAPAAPAAAQPPAQPADPIRELVGNLELERYKAILRGLGEFGDRQQGTKRNRDAVDWIEAQLKSYGCTNTERITYMYPSPEASDPATVAAQAARAGGAGQGAARGGGQGAGQGAGRGGRGAQAGTPPAPATTQTIPLPGSPEWVRRGREGGSSQYGYRGRTGVSNALDAQPDERLRAINAEPSTPGERQQVFCTKIGTTRPQEMYIVGAHMDGLGKGQAINDDASGTALVMELARILHMPGVTTDVSVRFILWNNEESGLNGAWAYVNQREKLQGIESPAGSGRYPEPKWLGMIQHDMMMWDHGMPKPDGTVDRDQRPEADVNIEFQSDSKFADQSMKLALALKLAADQYTTHYPATMGPHMTNTDSRPFQDRVAAVSLRENERGMQTGAGWNPHWHQPTDVFTTFTDKDFLLGLNAAQVTLSGIAKLAGVKIAR
jgi:Peptidase family M28